MAQPRGQLSLIHKKRETPGVSLFYMVCTSHSTRPYTTLAAVPNTMTGPATVNIFTAVPVIRPSACVKIGTREIFALFYWVFGSSNF